jgi:hypothetical protein
MNHPGVWILGAVEDPVGEGALGIVIEFAKSSWDYTIFGKSPSQQ